MRVASFLETPIKSNPQLQNSQVSPSCDVMCFFLPKVSNAQFLGVENPKLCGDPTKPGGKSQLKFVAEAETSTFLLGDPPQG